MQLSIVIPAFNEEKLLPGTLDAVAQAAVALTERGIAHEVIVCDNNSTDGTAEIARSRGAAVIFEPVNQISRARNAGATMAKGECLLFLDADSRPSHELFADLAELLHDESVLYGGCVMQMDESWRWARATLAVWHGLARWRRYAAGSFFCVRRAAFEAVGGFSTQLFAAEEIELSKRLRALARRQHQRFVFLTAHPLVTSARKIRSQKFGGHLRFFVRTLLTGGRNLRRREGCDLWYDGKR